jgi:hypothetical protein
MKVQVNPCRSAYSMPRVLLQESLQGTWIRPTKETYLEDQHTNIESSALDDRYTNT